MYLIMAVKIFVLRNSKLYDGRKKTNQQKNTFNQEKVVAFYKENKNK